MNAAAATTARPATTIPVRPVSSIITQWAVIFLGILFPAFSVAADPPVSFHKDVEPILTRSCAGCHRPQKMKGKLDVTSYAALAHGGKKGKAIEPREPAKSLLITQVSGDDPSMPQKGQKLTADEIGLLTHWIRQGAKDDSAEASQSSRATEGRPQYPSVYAVAPVIDALACSPNGAVLAVGGSHEVLLQHADGSGLIDRLASASAWITSICYSADGQLLVAAGGAAGEAGRIDVWDASNHKLLHAYSISGDTLFGLSLSPDAARAAVACPDATVRVISLADGKELARLDPFTDWALCTAFTVDGTKLIAGGRDKELRLFDLSSRKQVDVVNEPVEPLVCLARKPGEDVAACGGSGGLLRIFKVSDLQKRTEEKRDPNRIRELERQNGPINALAFSPDGKWLASACIGEARVYLAADGHRVSTCLGNAGPVFAVCFSPDSTRLYTAGFDGQARIFDAQKGELKKAFVPVPR